MMVSRWTIAIILLCVWETDSINKTITAEDVELKLDGLFYSFQQLVIPTILRTIRGVNMSKSCKLSFLRLFAEFAKKQVWALKMIDASAKIPAGMLEGTILFPGDYDQCLDITVRRPKSRVEFEGKYCLIKFFPSEEMLLLYHRKLGGVYKHVSQFEEGDVHTIRKLNYGFFVGLCVPSTCSTEDVNQLAHYVTGDVGLEADASCETLSEERTLNAEQIAVLCILSLILVLAIVGTGLDVHQQPGRNVDPGNTKTFLISFSVISNTRRLFQTTDHELSTVCGFRVLSLFWVILVHSYFFITVAEFARISNLLVYFKYFGDLAFKTVTRATLALDTFFLLSGMLNVYLYKKTSGKQKRRGIIYTAFIVCRFLLAQLLLYAMIIIYPLYGSGPLSKITFEMFHTNCINNWWLNALFIQNFVEISESCFLHTWFLAALMQLYILLSFVVPLLFRYPKIGIAINVLLIVIGSLSAGILTSIYNLFSSIDFDKSLTKTIQTLEIIHTRPYPYLCSYCIGVLLGYIIVTKRNWKINFRIQVVCWLMSACGIVTAVYGSHFFKDKRELVILDAAFHRTIWSLSVSWILFASVKGYAGMIARLLSCRAMVFLDKLSFLAYLLHPLVLIYRIANTRTTVYLSQLEQVYLYIPTIVITVVLSYIFNVSFEQPLKCIFWCILNKISKKLIPCSRKSVVELHSVNTLSKEETTIDTKCHIKEKSYNRTLP